MKRKISSIILALVLLLTVLPVVDASNTVALTYSGLRIELNSEEIIPQDSASQVVEPFSINGTTYLPVRAVASALGLHVDWRQADNMVVLQSGGTASAGTGTAIYTTRTVQTELTNITIGVELDGQILALSDVNGTPVSPIAFGGTTYLPVRAIASALSLSVDWRQADSTVVLSTERAESSMIFAMITDVGDVDDRSFNQMAWQGTVAAGRLGGIEHFYIKPLEQSDSEYINAIDAAIANGATTVVTAGYLFEVAVFDAQKSHPDVNFILVDGTPHSATYGIYETAANTVGLQFVEEQAGFLAGYAAVLDGNRNLGFMGGMAVPAVVRYGYGFLQGANYAAEQLGVNVKINYHYTNSFAPSPEAKNTAQSWFTDGIEVIFSCGGGMGNSVMAAAEEVGGQVIGVDLDQSTESETILTSAMKNISGTVEQILTLDASGNFPGGEDLRFGVAEQGVMLPMETSRFTSFSQADYEAVYALLASGNIEIIGSDSYLEPDALKLPAVTLTCVE